MIDLSYLTEEEQEMIMTVLKRDAELKRAEEDRIKHLQKTLRDSSRLKYMTGEWFYETKSKRHRDKIHGSDIIRASMRQKKPVTLLELSQSKAEKPSFVNSEKRDIFIPPELSGLIEEPEEEQEEERKSDHPSLETQGDKLKKTATPSVKQRQNPFNSMSDGEETADEREVHLTNGALQPVKTSEGEERSKNTSRDELVLSVENVSTVPSTPTSKFSDSEKIKKMSRSVPAFLQQESDGRDTDSTSENSFHIGRQRKIGSSLTNLSNSSGMASMSSVSGSVMSIYSGDFGNVDVTGNIQFAIDYVEQLNELHIFVVQCKDLAAADPKKNRSDPYVKSYLLPDKAKMGKRKTSVKKKTLNPTYNEILRYKISKETLKTQTLNLSVWHNDTFGRNSFLGEVDLDLSKWDWSNTQLNFFPLKPRTPSGLQFTDYRGEMRLALRFLPQISQSKNTPNTGEVHIWVKDCKSLPAIRGTAIDPFVKCSVLPDTSRKSRQKTRVLKKTANPVFNHTMVYDGFRVEDLREACVELTVWDHDRLANHFLGGLRLGLGTGKSYGAVVDWMDSNTDEATLWERMIDSPNEWVEDVLPLRMLMMAKSSWK
nr:PREDICTED: synaptotagmin-like protein 2 isoform X10 [Lepisosteus oculatus]